MSIHLARPLSILGAATLLLVATPTTATSATAVPTSHAGSAKSFRTTFTSHPGPQEPAGQTCDAANRCVLLFTSADTYAGDWTGSDVSGQGVKLNSPTYLAAATAVFTGTVTGCGTGTLILRVLANGSLTGPGTGTWTITPELGTGDLTNVIGGGTYRGNQVAFSYSGRISCPK